MSFSIVYASKLASSSALPSWPWVATHLVVLVMSAFCKPFLSDSGGEVKILPAHPPIPPLTTTLIPTPTIHIPLRPTPTIPTQFPPSPWVGLSFMLLMVFASFMFGLGIIWKSSKMSLSAHGDISLVYPSPSGPIIPKKRNAFDVCEAQASSGAPPSPPPSSPPSLPDTQPTQPSEPLPDHPAERNARDVPETQEPGGDPPPPPSLDTGTSAPNSKQSKRLWWFILAMISLTWYFRKELFQRFLACLFQPLACLFSSLEKGYSQLSAETFRRFTTEWYLLLAFPLNFAIQRAFSIILFVFYVIASLGRLLSPFKIPGKIWKILKPFSWWGRILSITVSVALVAVSIKYTPWSEVILHSSNCLDVAMTALAPVWSLLILVLGCIYVSFEYALWRPFFALRYEYKVHIGIALIIYHSSRLVLRPPTILQRVRALEKEVQRKSLAQNNQNSENTSPSPSPPV
ncbi:hypothetical protein E4T56_gene18975 [Termitomyces sp. T112]|nr:hypothetical protein E4T56_gene18975 [Termitomyces sp. T112]